MIRLGSGTGWMTALFALLVALLVAASSVDAAACAPDANPPASLGVDAAPVHGSDVGGPDRDAICSHGHCHHNGTAMVQTPEPMVRKSLIADVVQIQPAAPLTSRRPTGPERPPRH